MKYYDAGQGTAVHQLWLALDRECLIEGPAGTGKTRGVLEKIYGCAMKYPGSRYLICRKTRESMAQSVLVTLESKVLPEGHPEIGKVSRVNRHSYVFSNGSEIVVGGMNKPERIMSTEYDIIAGFEGTEFSLTDIEALLTRLRNFVAPFQQLIIDCNPGPPTHFLNQRAEKGLMRRFLSRHEHNPRLYRRGHWTREGREYLETLGRLSGHRKARLRDGKWVAAEGLVYEGFDKAKHCRPARPIAPDARRIITVDFGYNNPFSASWWALDHDGVMIRYRQIYMTGRLVSAHAKRILALTGSERIEAVVCDHDAEGRATLEEEGIPTTPAIKEIERGIQKCEERINAERPRIIFYHDVLDEVDEKLVLAGLPFNTEGEFDCYQWPMGADGKPKKETPIDKDNHGLDEMRYGVMYFAQATGPLKAPALQRRPLDPRARDTMDLGPFAKSTRIKGPKRR